MTRRFGLINMLLGLLHGLLLVPRWLLTTPHSPAARAIERRFMTRIARRLVAQINLRGAPLAGPGTLYIANHISWIDILVLGSVLDAEFIAKDEVKSWPVIGLLARRTGTIFIAREERHRVDEQAARIAARLKSGASLILFPEGTTGDGETILPFRSSLFAAAIHASRIQPLALAYQPAGIGWTDQEPLLANARRVTRLRLTATIQLSTALANAGEDRKKLAEYSRNAVIAAQQLIREQSHNDTAN
jgi:lyso-ornithine lipid O-acyltransferase